MAQESRLLITIDSQQALTNARQVNAELHNLQGSGDQAAKSMLSASGAAKALAVQLGALISVSKGIAMADSYVQLADRIRNATDSAEEYNMVQKRLLATANTTYRALAEAQEVYLGLAGGMKALGKTTKDTLDVSDSLSFAFTANAARADQAQSAIDAFSKSMARGKVDSNAWISIVTAADNIIADMAKTTGKTEAEIRKLGVEGKISLEDLIKTLKLTKDENERLADNIKNSLADGFTKLSNSVTDYLGRLNDSTEATNTAAAALGALGDNIDVVASAAMAVGIGYLTKVLLTQTVAVRASIAASIQRRAADVAQLESNVRLAAVEVARTRSVAAQALTEINLARAERNSAVTREARSAATIRLTQAEIAHNIATHQSTAAVTANTAAQNALNASRAMGTRLLAMVGGPIGAVTLGVTALAAGYMYMSAKTEEANRKLAEQAEVAKRAKEELLALKGLEKDAAIEDMTEAFKRQNAALSESSSTINVQLDAIKLLYKGNQDVADIVDQAKNGTISMSDALKKFNEIRINKDVYETLKKNSTEFTKNAKEATGSKDALALFKIEVTLAGTAAQNAINGIADNTKELKGNKTAAEEAAAAQAGFKASLYDREFEAAMTKGLLAKGYSEGQIKAMIEAANYARKEGVKVTREMYDIALSQYSLEQKNSAVIAKRAEDQKKVTEEQKKQAELLKKTINSKTIDSVIARGEGNYNSFNRGKAGDSGGAKMNLTGMTVGQIRDLQKSGKISAVGKYQTISKTLQGAIDAGIVSTAERFNAEVQERILQQYLLTAKKGRVNFENYIRGKNDNLTAANLDVAMEFASVASPVTGKSYYHGDKAGNKASISVKEAQDALKASRELYAQAIASGKSAQDAWKAAFNGATSFIDGSDTQKDLDKLVQDAIKVEQEIAALRDKFSTEDVVRNNQRIADINNAEALGLSDLIAKINEQYDAQDALAKLQFDMQVNGWKWVGDEKLRKEAEVNKAITRASKEMNAQQKADAKKSIDEQVQYEIAQFEAAQLLKQKQYDLMFGSQMRDIQDRISLHQAPLDQKDRLGLAIDQRNAYSQNDGDRRDTEGDLDELLKAKEITTQEHYKRLEDARLMHKEREYEISLEYKQKEDDLLKEQQQTQLQLYGQLISQASSVWGDMTQLVRDAKGENSKTFKAMFYAQKEMAIMQQVINTELAAGATTAQTGIFGLPAATAIRAIGYASVGLIKAQQLAGFSSGGYTGAGGKYDPAGIVHKGEVVWSQADIKRWGGVSNVESMRTGDPSLGLERQQLDTISNRSSGDVISAPITVQVNVQSDGSSSVDAQGQSKQLGEMIGNAVRAVIRQEQRQGGLLSK